MKRPPISALIYVFFVVAVAVYMMATWPDRSPRQFGITCGPLTDTPKPGETGQPNSN